MTAFLDKKSSHPAYSRRQPPLRLEDDYRHEPADDPMWREGATFSFYDEASGVFGGSWLGIRPQRGVAEVTFYVCDRDGTVLHELTNWQGFKIERIGPENPFQFGPVKFECLDPHQRWRYRLDDGDCKIDITWDAVNPVYDYPWGELVDSRHIEHTGRVEGVVNIGDRRIPISGFGQRDRAWGRRSHSDYGHWVWLNPTFGEDFACNVGMIRHRDEDLLFGTIWKDNKQGELEYLRLTSQYSVIGGAPLKATADIRDEFGRELTIEVDPLTFYANAFGDDLTKMGVLYQGQARYIAASRVSHGVCDFMWTDMRAYRRASFEVRRPN
jgi:hypothetical protein